MPRSATRQAPGTRPSNEERELESPHSMVLNAEEWQLLTTAAAIAAPGVPLDEWAREILVRAARRMLAADDELH